MDRFFIFLMLALSVGLLCCSETGGSYGGGKESLLSRSKRSKLWHPSCTCPDFNELQHPKKHACPCDGFSSRSLSEHRSHHHHHHHKNKRHVLDKAKCRKFLRHCAFKGIHVPL